MNKGEVIRNINVTDLPQICHLEKICFEEESFSPRQMNYLAIKAKADFLVTVLSDEITSYIILLKRKNSRAMRIYSIAVSPAHRGKGLAQTLLTEAEFRAKKEGYRYLSLEVSELNRSAVSLYLKWGFKVFGERLLYYKNGSKALLMRKEVSQNQF